MAYAYRPAAHLTAEGEDAADFLQSQFSNDLRPFGAGACTYGLWLSAKGKVQSDGWVLQTGAESFRIVSEHCLAGDITAHMQRHIVADDVEIRPGADLSGLSLVGAGATGALRGLGLDMPAAGSFCRGEGVVVFPGRRSSKPGYELLFEGEGGFALAREQMEKAGAAFVSEDWIQLERMEAGVPAIPAELGPEDLPGETDLTGDAVSLNKGCFLGQEVVARMHNVGRPRRGLHVLHGSGPIPALPAEIHNEAGGVAGWLRSACARGEGWQGVAMLKLSAVEAGVSLRLHEETVSLAGRLPSAFTAE